MKIFYQDDTGDHEREYGQWQGLILTVKDAPKPALRLRTCQGKRLRLDAEEVAVLWAQIDEAYSGVNVYRALAEQPQCLPAISAAEVQKISTASEHARKRLWLAYFVNALQRSDMNCLSDGLWSLAYCDGSNPCHPHWRSKRKRRDWHLGATAEDWELLQASAVYLDWGLCGNGQVFNIRPPQARDSGRIKWWRKLARAGQLPPILVWQVQALDAFVILDGHDRLQACLLEGVQPAFAVLSSFYEMAVHGDARREQAILYQLEMAEQRIAQGVHINPDSLMAMQKVLIQAFDHRPMRRFVTRSTASLSLQQWQAGVNAFSGKDDQVYVAGL